MDIKELFLYARTGILSMLESEQRLIDLNRQLGIDICGSERNIEILNSKLDEISKAILSQEKSH